MTSSHIVVYGEEADLFPGIASALPTGVTAAYLTDPHRLQSTLEDNGHAAVVVVVPTRAGASALDMAAVGDSLKRLPLILIARDGDVSPTSLSALMALRPVAFVFHPFARADLRDVLERALTDAAPPTSDTLQATLTDTNRRLNARLQEINMIYTIGKSVVSSLDVNEILMRVIVAGVNLTQADEGFIILRENDRLFVRVRKARDDRFAERLHEEIADAVAWRVIRSGRPVMLHRETRLATGLLVRGLLYVPLQTPERGTVGVLGLANRLRDEPFNENQLFALSSVADYTAIALENARLYSMQAAEHSRLRAVLRQAAEAIIVTDMSNRLWLWSDTAAQAFDIGAEARGCLLCECTTNDQICELFEEADQDQAVLHTEIVLDDGRVFNAQLSSINGVGRVAVMQEITHLKELDRLKSEFVSTVSHDLRTPLTTIQGYVELLDRAGPLNDMQTKFVGKALSSLSHITALISDLLDIGRIEAGYDLEMQPLRMDELIRLATEAAGVIAATQDIDVSLELPQSPLWVWGNTRRLRQVLDNLISNALKYNRSGGRVRVSGRRDGDHVVVQVSDTGIGVPAEEQPRLFERFYRVQTPETEGIKGTGLGLAIVKSVIEKHRGRVWVESIPGQGSTFAFLLPIYSQQG